MSKLIDARGRSCPEPVIMTKKAIEAYEGEEVQVLVDSMVAVENVKRYAKNQGFRVEQGNSIEDFSLILNK